MKRSIHIVSSENGSIGEISLDLITELKNDFIITREFYSTPVVFDILLVHYINPKICDLKEFNSFKHKVLIQPIDGTVLNQDVIDAINKFDVIITPSIEGKKILEENNIGKRIVVIPNYFKPTDFEHKSYIELQSLLKGKIVFYSESNYFKRKNVEQMYEAFIKAFSNHLMYDKVILIHKDNADFKNHEVKEEIKDRIIKLQKCYKYPAKIIKITQNLEKEKMSALWNLYDIYYSVSKFEGFSIPMLRAAVMKKPVICLDNIYSGYNSFLNSRNSFKINCYYDKTGEKDSIYSKESLNAFALTDDISAVLVDSFKYFKFKKNSLLKEEQFSFNSVINQYKKILNELRRT